MIKRAKSELSNSSDLQLISNFIVAANNLDNKSQVQLVSCKVNNICVISDINETVVKLGETSLGKNSPSYHTHSTDSQQDNSCTSDSKILDKTHSTSENCYFEVTPKKCFDTKTTRRITPKISTVKIKYQPTTTECTEKNTHTVKTIYTYKTTKITYRCLAKSFTESDTLRFFNFKAKK